jgi:hypothetical protein
MMIEIRFIAKHKAVNILVQSRPSPSAFSGGAPSVWDGTIYG